MLSVFKDEGNIKYSDIYGKNKDGKDGGYGVTQAKIHDDVTYYAIADLDPVMSSYLTIKQTDNPISVDLATVDEYRTEEAKVPANTFWIFDKTCGTLKKVMEDERKESKRECLGIFPVVTTAANALYAQSLIEVQDNEIIDYETVNGVTTKPEDENNPETVNHLLSTDCVMAFSQEWKPSDATSPIDTVSRDANGYFLPIQMNTRLDGIDREHTKKIGIVVYKAYMDSSEGNKISFSPVESFVGSLNKDDKNSNTGASTFIDNIINTQSEYIYFFSNCFVKEA